MDLKKILEEGELKTDKTFTPLLLGDGQDANKVRILKQIGFKKDIEEQEDLLGQQVVLDNIKKSYETDKVYSLNNILKICDQYHMIFAPVHKNKNKNIDINAVVEQINTFNTKFEKSIDNIQQDFFVLSTSNLFAGKTQPFMLFYKPTAENTYILIYNSNDVIKERRKILGKIFNTEDSVTTTLFFIIAVFEIFLISKINNIGGMIMLHWILTIILTIMSQGLLFILLSFLTDRILFSSNTNLSSLGSLVILNDDRADNCIIINSIVQTTTHQADQSKYYKGDNYYRYYYSQYLKFRKNEKNHNKSNN